MLVFNRALLDALRILHKKFVEVGWERVNELAHLLAFEAIKSPLASGVTLALKLESALFLPTKLIVFPAVLEDYFLIKFLKDLRPCIA